MATAIQSAVRVSDRRLQILRSRELAFEPDAFSPLCPTRLVLDIAATRWTVLVIGAVEEGPRSFGEIRARVGKITPKVLTTVLRALERDGIVARKAFAQVPRRVEYRLTPLGKTLTRPLGTLRRWAEENVKEILVSRIVHDETHVAPGRSRYSGPDELRRHGGKGRHPAGV